MIRSYLLFMRRCARIAFKGDWRYQGWLAFLFIVSLIGLNAYAKQLVNGLGVTDLSDNVSWGVYIANFTFMVGIADAAVMLVVPVYIYRNKSLHDLVIFGQLLAVAAIIMSLGFVIVDLGRPDRFLHLIPGIGKMNFPESMLSWDVIALNGYLLLSIYICGHLLYSRYKGHEPRAWFYIPFVLFSIFWAVSLHAITAFLYVGLGGKPFWNTAIMGPRFIASAFVSGPALVILAFQCIRGATQYRIPDKAIMTLRTIVQVAMIVNVFLLLNELFKEFYTDTLHVSAAKFLYFGLDGHYSLVPWIWTAVVFNLTAMILLALPHSRNLRFLNLACILAIVGIWIEKGMGMVVPGFIPSSLGEISDYTPTINETLICLGIWAFGLFCYTIFIRMSLPILEGKFTFTNAGDWKKSDDLRLENGVARTKDPAA
ncbi:MAG: polysulfide reductase NrfD [Verrucomicrobia bacterium]|jgi:Ni/Fe-hydrogenase subunit HybB-like protein|nr:polysulfide reductase NrfD [Verrucomicrobiota bacterium]